MVKWGMYKQMKGGLTSDAENSETDNECMCATTTTRIARRQQGLLRRAGVERVERVRVGRECGHRFGQERSRDGLQAQEDVGERATSQV